MHIDRNLKFISTEMETEGRKKEDKERREGGREGRSDTFLQAFVVSPKLPPVS